MSSRALLRHLVNAKIQTRPLWQPAHLSPAHRGMAATNCAVAEGLNRAALSLSCSVGLTRKDQACVIGAVRNARGREK